MALAVTGRKRFTYKDYLETPVLKGTVLFILTDTYWGHPPFSRSGDGNGVRLAVVHLGPS